MKVKSQKKSQVNVSYLYWIFCSRVVLHHMSDHSLPTALKALAVLHLLDFSPSVLFGPMTISLCYLALVLSLEPAWVSNFLNQPGCELTLCKS